MLECGKIYERLVELLPEGTRVACNYESAGYYKSAGHYKLAGPQFTVFAWWRWGERTIGYQSFIEGDETEIETLASDIIKAKIAYEQVWHKGHLGDPTFEITDTTIIPMRQN